MAHAGVLPLLLVVFQFAVVIRLSRHLMTMKPATAKALYITYSVITGITFSYVISSYTGFTVSLAFFGRTMVVDFLGRVFFTLGMFVYLSQQ